MFDLIGARERLFAVLATLGGIALFLFIEKLQEPDIGALDLALELVDILPIVITSVGLAMLFGVVRQQREDHGRLMRDLEVARIKGQRWRTEARAILNGLGSAIDTQFTRWNLTPAERDVAMLLLKGLSHKEIADLRTVSERTVREQARALYAKAGLSGRASLSAFFLEDMLAPVEGSAPDAAEGAD